MAIASKSDAIGFQTFAMESPHAIRTLRSQLMKEKVDKVAALADNNARDFADYKYRIGQINGLQMAIEICEAMQEQERQ
jgi:hypothetical protein